MLGLKAVVLEDFKKITGGKRDGHLDNGAYFRFDTKKGDVILAFPPPVYASFSVNTATPDGHIAWEAFAVAIGTMGSSPKEDSGRSDDIGGPRQVTQKKAKK